MAAEGSGLGKLLLQLHQRLGLLVVELSQVHAFAALARTVGFGGPDLRAAFEQAAQLFGADRLAAAPLAALARGLHPDVLVGLSAFPLGALLIHALHAFQVAVAEALGQVVQHFLGGFVERFGVAVLGGLDQRHQPGVELAGLTHAQVDVGAMFAQRREEFLGVAHEGLLDRLGAGPLPGGRLEQHRADRRGGISRSGGD